MNFGGRLLRHPARRGRGLPNPLAMLKEPWAKHQQKHRPTPRPGGGPEAAIAEGPSTDLRDRTHVLCYRIGIDRVLSVSAHPKTTAIRTGRQRVASGASRASVSSSKSFLPAFAVCSILLSMSEFEAGAMRPFSTVGLPHAGTPRGRLGSRAAPRTRGRPGGNSSSIFPYASAPPGRRQTMPANETAIAASLDRATRLPVATLREGPTIGSCPPPRAASLCQRTSLITLDQRLEAERSGGDGGEAPDLPALAEPSIGWRDGNGAANA